MFISQQRPKVKTHSLIQKESIPSHMSVMCHMSAWMCFYMTHEYIASNKPKKAVECSFMVWPPGAEGAVSPCCEHRYGGQRWLYGLTVIGHLYIQTTLHSSSVARLFSKQAVFAQTATSQADKRAHVVITGCMFCQETCKDSLLVMSLDQLRCESLRGTRSS